MHEEIWSKTVQQEGHALREDVPGKVAGPQVVAVRRGPAAVAKAKDLKRVRKALGKSQSELAALLGISTRAVQSYEQGWRRLPPYVQRLTGLLLFLKRRKDGPNLSPCWEILECDGGYMIVGTDGELSHVPFHRVREVVLASGKVVWKRGG